MGIKLYYRVTAANGALAIRPLNSEEEVNRAIEQSSIIAKNVQDNVASFFILSRSVNVSSFYSWLAEADQYAGLTLEKPHYIENDPIPVKQSSGFVLALPRF